ncbi:ankyrin repeat-containing domain protein [Pterulicium gracile]|uniref:Ankyrin repeat-containing domain protein n=1 Tax=Pterulicium gracile TaxID=1884261 RepID=A0A5C3QKD1_9AGAR|nr:ankyrin repeat-containing domain protein [Pterula gracilis]
MNQCYLHANFRWLAIHVLPKKEVAAGSAYLAISLSAHGLSYLLDAHLAQNPDTPLDQRNAAGWTALQMSAPFGFPVISAFLLRKGASIELPGFIARSPLATATRHNQLHVASFLLSQGARLESRDVHGRTPLLSASRHGKLDVVQLLVNAGADLQAQDSWRNTALTLAAFHGRHETEFILKRGALVDSSDRTRRTPIMDAASNGYSSIVSLLLAHGADTELVDDDGKIAATIAEEQGYGTIAQILPQSALSSSRLKTASVQRPGDQQHKAEHTITSVIQIQQLSGLHVFGRTRASG